MRNCLFFSCLFGALLPAQTLTWAPVPTETLTQRVSAVPVQNEERAARLQQLFGEVGCSGERLRHGRVNKKWENIVCTLPGSTDDVVVIGAHFDHVKQGEGAIDNWSGTSLLPSLYQTLAASPRHFTYVFAGFAEEEKGLYGARAFVKELGKEGLPKVKAMINIDSVGLTAPKVWVTRSDKRLVQMVAQVGSVLNIPVSGMSVDGVGDSDSHPFADKKIPVLDIHSLTGETLPVLHSDKDTIGALVMEHYLDAYKLLAATLVYIDGQFRP